MKKYCYFVVINLIFFINVLGQSEFVEPWKDKTKALVLDPYRKNYLDCSKLHQEPRVAGIIHKASENLTPDPKYRVRKKECKETYNYKWGSYHLGRHRNPLAQANLYLKTANPTDDEVMALDLEDSYAMNSTVMSLPEALIFIKRIKEVTGRYPLLYVPERVRAEILQKYGPDSEFAKTPLWYARYCNQISCYFPPVSPSAILDKYLFWQFATNDNCPSRQKAKGGRCTPGVCPLNKCPLSKPIPGTDWGMDVNVYNGTVEELRSKWAGFSPHL